MPNKYKAICEVDIRNSSTGIHVIQEGKEVTLSYAIDEHLFIKTNPSLTYNIKIPAATFLACFKPAVAE